MFDENGASQGHEFCALEYFLILIVMRMVRRQFGAIVEHLVLTIYFIGIFSVVPIFAYSTRAHSDK